MLNSIVKNLLEYVDVEEADITEHTNPVKDLHLNSYDYISLVGRLENELGVTIPERDLHSFQTLGDLDRYVRTKLQL